MRVMIYVLPKVKQKMLAEHLMKGFLANGDTVRFYNYTPDYAVKTQYKELADVDLAVMIGGQSFEIYKNCSQRVPTLFVDKVYVGRRDFYRMVLNGHIPQYLGHLQESAKVATSIFTGSLEKSGVDLHPRRIGGAYIIYCGSSQAYCTYHGLGDALKYDKMICDTLNEIVQGRKEIVYRMKSSLVLRDKLKRYTIPLILPDKVTYSGPDEKLAELLPDCHCLVTYGSNAATEALAAGVPAVVLSPKGINPVWSIAETDITNVMRPRWPSDDERFALLSALTRVQFSVDDIASGYAWSNIKPWLGVIAA